MSVTYGFYNSINHDRKYDAVQFASIFDGIISDGVYENIKSSPNDPNSSPFKVKGNGYKNQVTVDVGRAWFYHTWTYNDAKIVVTLPDASIGKWRCDAIVIDIDSRQTVRENKIICVQGTKTTTTEPSSGLDAFVNVYKPDLINDGLHYQIPLYYIERRRIEDENQSPNIEDAYLKRCVGDGSLNCPYVGNMLGSIDIQAHLDHWESAWYEWFENQSTGFKKVNTDTFNAFVATMRQYYDDWRSGFETYNRQQRAVWGDWIATQEADFESWFERIQNILDDDTAGHLLMEIDRLAARVTPVECGGTGNAHGHIQSGYQTSTWFDSPMGEYATAEGMNAVASGKCAHAEGGGIYSTGFVEAHLEDNGRKIATDSTNPYYDYGHHMNCSISKTVSGSASQDVTWYHISGDTNNDLGYNYIISADDRTTWGSSESTEFLHGRMVSAYLYVELKDETTGEILKNDVLTDGDNVKYSEAYNNGVRTISSTGSRYVFGDSVYEEVDNNTTVGYDDNNNRIYQRYNYWYMDGDTPENSTVIFSLVPYLQLNDYKAYIGYTGGPNSQKMSIINGDDKNHGLLIKAGNTHTYSIKMYCSYTMESDCIDDGYYRKDVPNSVYTLNVQKGTERGVTELIDIETIKSIAVEWVDYNGICISRNIEIPIRTNQSSSSKDTDSYICCQSDNDEVIAVKLRYSYSKQKWTHLMIAPNMYASESYSGRFKNSYVVKISNHELPGYTMSKIVDGVEKGFEYYLKWIPAHNGLAATSPPTRAMGAYSHAEGYGTKAVGIGAHAEGYYDRLEQISPSASDSNNYPGAYGNGSHVEGVKTKAIGVGAHAEGQETVAAGNYSHAEGDNTNASNFAAHAEGKQTVAGPYAHAEGYKSNASGSYSHAEGQETIASADYSHAEGYKTEARANYSHVEGYQSCTYSSETHGDASYSHAGGLNGYAHLLGQFVHGNFGFGGTAKEFINTDGTVTFPDAVSAFNGGSFYFKNTESSSKSVSVNLIYNSDRGTGTPEGLRGTWLIIKRDVPVSGVSNAAGNAGIWLAMVKNTTGGILLHKIFESETTAAACTMASDGTSLRFTIKGSGSNNGLAAAVQIIRIM